MARTKIAPGQMSFDDLCWNGDADIKPDATDIQKPVKKINPHVFRQFIRGTLGERVYICDHCGLVVDEFAFNDGNYDLNCPGFIPHTNRIVHDHERGTVHCAYLDDYKERKRNINEHRS